MTEKEGNDMSEAYLECLVKAKGNMVFKILRYLFYVLSAIAFLSLAIGMGFFGVLFGFGFAAAGYYIGMLSEVEYEYLYMDKELTVDRILAQSNRKRVASYSMERMEIMAPVISHRIDSYKNRQVKETDYSIGYAEQPDRRYAFYYEGGERILISPSEEMIKVMKNANPRKVFSD